MKGKDTAIKVFAPIKSEKVKENEEYVEFVIGRECVKQTFDKITKNLGKKNVILIEGNTGTGKSKLADYFLRTLTEFNVNLFFGSGDSLHKSNF